MDSKQIQVNIALKVKEKRLAMGLSQKDIADILGVSFQQVQKYETGHNRIDVTKLIKLAEYFNVPVIYFFEGFDRPADTEKQALEKAEFQKLSKHYFKLPPKVLQNILDMIESLAKSSRS